jgi:hypothetical protein
MRKDQVSQSEEMTDPNILKEQQQYIPSVNIRGEVLLIIFFTVMHEKLKFVQDFFINTFPFQFCFIKSCNLTKIT